MQVTGILSVSNGTSLNYPFTAVASNLAALCDDVIVGLDPSYPEDFEAVETLNSDTVHMLQAPWDRSNRNGGHEIAMQMDSLVKLAEGASDWVVVLQADEFFHEKDFEMLRMFMERHTFSDITGLVTERLYFWKDFNTVRKDWNADLVRIFKPGHWSFMADGTSKDGMYSGPVKPGKTVKLSYPIYHYSRVGSPDKISRRVRNLDGFFHSEESLIPFEELPEYDFVPRMYDNFAKSGFPDEVPGAIVPFDGTHPEEARKWYGNP